MHTLMAYFSFNIPNETKGGHGTIHYITIYYITVHYKYTIHLIDNPHKQKKPYIEVLLEFLINTLNNIDN